MSYDSTTDPVVAALRAIALAEVVPALAPTLGSTFPAISQTFGFPIALAMLPTLQLPALAIYVERETAFRTGRHNDRKLSVVFEYVGPITPLAKLDTTWPLLRAVWNQVLLKMEQGTVSGVDVLRLLGVTWVADENADVQYDHAPNGDQTFPHFMGRIAINYRPAEFDPSTLATLTKLFASVDLYQNGAETNHHIVQADTSVG